MRFIFTPTLCGHSPMTTNSPYDFDRYTSAHCLVCGVKQLMHVAPVPNDDAAPIYKLSIVSHRREMECISAPSYTLVDAVAHATQLSLYHHLPVQVVSDTNAPGVQRVHATVSGGHVDYATC